MRRTLLLLPALMLTVGCGARPSPRSLALSKAAPHARAAKQQRRRASQSQRLVAGVLSAAVDLVAYEALQARERRLIVAMIRAQTPPPAAPPSMAAPAVAVAAASPIPQAPKTLADRMGQPVRLTLVDGQEVVGALRGYTGIYAFVKDDAGQTHQVAATDIKGHAGAGDLASVP